MRITVGLALALGVATPAGAELEHPDGFAAERQRMVEEQIEARGIRDPRVLDALRSVPRQEFVPEARRAEAYADRPLPIGEGQTISQPYIVALMTELAAVGPASKVLEVGTGSGYQAAVLAACGAQVYSIEIVDALAKRAKQDLARLGYAQVHVRSGDGYAGWPEHAPFDAILVTAAAPRVPPALLEQLRVGGRLVIPVGETGREQVLQVHTRTAAGADVRDVVPVRFVPMTGTVREQP
jgi:protein-L-isoaspartate(D-aspartate) O-methyltransferase